MTDDISGIILVLHFLMYFFFSWKSKIIIMTLHSRKDWYIEIKLIKFLFTLL